MKTLDEVIDTFEKACDLERRCEGCPGCLSHDYGCPNDGAESVPDALHYLKRLKQIEAKIEKIAIGNVEDTLSKMDNPPLTWDELKTMRGKPVWVVDEGYQTWEFWSLVYWMKDEELILLNENGQTTYPKNEQGTVWQAYRKERQNVQS